MSLHEHAPASGSSSAKTRLPGGRTAAPIAPVIPLVRLARDSDETDPWTLSDTARESAIILSHSQLPTLNIERSTSNSEPPPPNSDLYRRDTVVLYPDPGGRPWMQTMTPMIFRTWVSRRIHYYIETWDRQTMQILRKIKTLSTSEAETILVSPDFWPHLPEIRRTHPIPMPVLRASGKLETLPAGYDEETKIFTFKS